MPRAAAVQAVGQELPPVRAHDHLHAIGRAHPVLPPVGRRAAEAARPAGILDHAVAFDLERMQGLDHLDRLVGQVAAGVGDAEGAVAVRHGAPASGQGLGADELPAAVHAADRREGDAALAGRRDLVRHDLGENAEQDVDGAPADDGPRRTGRRRPRVDDGALGQADVDRPGKSLEIRNFLPRDAFHDELDGGFDERRRAVDRARHFPATCPPSPRSCGRRRQLQSP